MCCCTTRLGNVQTSEDLLWLQLQRLMYDNAGYAAVLADTFLLFLYTFWKNVFHPK